MSIKEGTSEIVFACYRPPNLLVTGNSAAKDSAIADAWRMSGMRSERIEISNTPSASVTMARNEHTVKALADRDAESTPLAWLHRGFPRQGPYDPLLTQAANREKVIAGQSLLPFLA